MTREIKKQIIEIINNIDDVNILNFIYLYLSKIKNELGENKMLRYEQIIKEFLQNNVKFKGMQNDGRILAEVEGVEHIYRCLEIDNTIRIYNTYTDLQYTINLR